jgi:predicted AAA+ superfamily ATPase
VSERFVERRAEEALSDTPVVLIVGPRRVGKTTLVRKMGEAGRTYITLDDQTVLEAAQSDPAGFIRGPGRRDIIDEIQRAPDLLLAIKKTVDEEYRPGRFLLTSSANVLTLPRFADGLAGRMETIQMLPLARAEVEGRTPTFLEHLFAGKLRSQREAILGDDLVQIVLLGGFPKAISRESERRRQYLALPLIFAIADFCLFAPFLLHGPVQHCRTNEGCSTTSKHGLVTS